MYTSFSAFTDFQGSYQIMPTLTNAAKAGADVARRKSPVLSRQELQRLIRDMVD